MNMFQINLLRWFWSLDKLEIRFRLLHKLDMIRVLKWFILKYVSDYIYMCIYSQLYIYNQECESECQWSAGEAK